MKLVVAVGGASGSVYAKRLLDVLAKTPGDREVALCFSKSGLEVWRHERRGVPSAFFNVLGNPMPDILGSHYRQPAFP